MIGARPSSRFAFSHPAHIIAFGFGAGLARSAPGTFGTLAAWPFGWMLAGAHPGALILLLAVLFLLGVWACDRTGRDLGVHDHGAMVWDEFVAFLVVLALVPRELGWHLAAFVLFRAFDIGKPPPIPWVERRFRNGFGAMLDDLLAAGYALVALAIAKRIFF